MDSLITALVILVISALATWLKQKGQRSELEDPELGGQGNAPPISRPSQPRPVTAPRPRPAATTWEEELRRLLETDSPAAPPPPLKIPPPRPVQAPLPPPTSVPPVFVPKPVVVSAPRVPMVEVASRELAPLSESKQAY